MSSINKLLPCPFCGCYAKVSSIELMGNLFFIVMCENEEKEKCNCRTQKYITEDFAVNSWNRRYKDDSISTAASALGKIGGSKTSSEKKLSSIINGKKGGRPKIVKNIIKSI